MDEADLVRLVDRLEERAESYVTLDQVERATSGRDVSISVSCEWPGQVAASAWAEPSEQNRAARTRISRVV